MRKKITIVTLHGRLRGNKEDERKRATSFLTLDMDFCLKNLRQACFMRYIQKQNVLARVKHGTHCSCVCELTHVADYSTLISSEKKYIK